MMMSRDPFFVSVDRERELAQTAKVPAVPQAAATMSARGRYRRLSSVELFR